MAVARCVEYSGSTSTNIVGLQRLGHDVYYIEDSARLPYDPSTGEITNDLVMRRDAHPARRRIAFEGQWGVLRALPSQRGVLGLPKKRLAELYREADAILNVCGTQELNDDLLQSERILYVERIPVWTDQGRSRESAALRYLGKHRALFTFW